MLEHVPQYLLIASPLIIFGTFVLAYERRIFSVEEDKEKSFAENEVFSELRKRLQKQRERLSSVVSSLVVVLIALGIFFAFLYAWIGYLGFLFVALGFISAVVLTLLSISVKLGVYLPVHSCVKSWLDDWKSEKIHPEE